jgi:PncC family amidohydrolase
MQIFVSPRILLERISSVLRLRGITISTMESCTGGFLAKFLTDVSGSSYLRGSIITYATDVKVQFGVPQDLIKDYGVISSPTALAMAHAARELLQTHIGIGITGIAGPTQVEDKPVGQVHIGIAAPNGHLAREWHFLGNRSMIRQQAVYEACRMLSDILIEDILQSRRFCGKTIDIS